MARQTRTIRHELRGQLPDSLSVDTTAPTGTPVTAGADGGGYRLRLSATDEPQVARLSAGDVLPFAIGDIISASFILKLDGGLDADSQVAFGLATAGNNNVDAIAAAALFRCVGSEAVTVETDDGTNDIAAVDTGQALGSEFKRFEIDFASHNTSIEAPSVSLGRGSNLEFYAANQHGSQRRVASGTRFDMTNYSGDLQPFVQVQKASGVGEAGVVVLEICVEVNQAA